jgi:hypothetical protein
MGHRDKPGGDEHSQPKQPEPDSRGTSPAMTGLESGEVRENIIAGRLAGKVVVLARGFSASADIRRWRPVEFGWSHSS